jgi:GTP pyrophosphokinase
VEILTSPGATPSEGWLGFAVTNRARGKIRHWIKTQRLTESISLGREMLQRELKKRRKKMPEESDLLEVAQSFGLSDVPLLFAKLGEQILSVQNVSHRIYPDLMAPKSKGTVDRIRSLAQAPVRGIRIQDISSLLIRMAQCCHPVPGDPVVGIITRGRGVSVHRQDCANVIGGQVDADRIMDLSWDVERDKLFSVRLAVYGSDRENMLADVARAISKTRTNIKQGFMDSEDSQAVGDFLLEVRNLAHLGKVMRAIKGVKGVTRVDRKQMTPAEPEGESA